MKTRVYRLFVYELRAAFRQKAEYVNPIVFFLIIVSLFPLAISSDPTLLAEIAPGIIWIGALMATLLALQSLFRQDAETGFMDKLLLAPTSLTLSVFIKIAVHWCMSGLPLVIVSPLLGSMLDLSTKANLILMLSLMLGTPVLSFIGAIMAALTLSIKHNGLLLPLLVLPLFVPVLIFGSSAVIAAQIGMSSLGQLKMLAALLVLSFMFAPFATTQALRIGEFQ